MNERMLLHLLARNALMTEAVAIEPVLLTLLVEAAGMTPPAHWTRWHAYSALKRTCSPYIGHEARSCELATSAHWEAFIAFIDAVLPDTEEYYSARPREEIEV